LHLRRIRRLAPLLLLGVCAAVLLPRRGALTAQAVLGWTPRRPALAALFLLALYALKSLSVFFPLAALELAAGLLFPLAAALALNLAGVALAQLLPYLLGRRRRGELENLLSRRPRLAALWERRQGRDFPFVLLLRLCGVLPGDLVSLALGAGGLDWGVYLGAGLLGSLPHMLAVTVLGSSLSDIRSEAFFLALAGNAAVTVLALLVWRRKGTR